jgi:hypothetical protein
MTSDDTGTRFDDIMDRLERAWGRWQDALARIDERDENGTALASSLMEETARGDEQAVEEIRALVEHSTYQQLPSPDTVDAAASLPDAQETMTAHHERLLGAMETVAETSEDIVAAVEERIGPLTWEQYTDRADRLITTGEAGT